MKKAKALKILIKAIIITAAVLLLFMFVIPILFNIFNIGNILGAAVSIGVILLTVFSERAVSFVKRLCKSKRGKVLFGTASVIFVAGIISFSAILGSIIYEDDGHNNNQQTLIVLGCAVRGNVPSITLSERVNAAYEYMTEHPESVAVLSGGQGNNENISEAECMYRLLTDKGIDKSRLFMENQSVSTETNIEYSKKIIEENKLGTDIAVVSSDYHLKRAKMICEKQGLEVATISAKSSIFDKPTFYLREVLGIVKEIVF